MLFLNADDVRRALPMREAVEVMKRAFAQLARGEASVPPRSVIPLPRERGDVLLMPAILGDGEHIGVKLLTLLPDNPKAGRPLIHALMTVFDGTTGEPAAVMDGGALTAIRTGAASGAATDFLARDDASVIAIIGAGRQGRTQLEAVHAVRAATWVRVFSRTPESAEQFAADMAERLDIDVSIAATAAEALKDADIVCTATTSRTPVFEDDDIRPGTHINAIGIYQPDRHELPVATVARAKVVVDQLEAAREEAGDLVLAVKEGQFAWNRVHAELGQIVAGQMPGRESPEEITLFKSVGLAVQDIAAAAAVVESALAKGLGTQVEL